MKEFTDYINHCASQFANIARCQVCPYEQCINYCADNAGADCYSCLSKIHRRANKDLTYRCERIIYNYILKHGHRYASEIDRIMPYFTNNQRIPLSPNVFSVGCGPCTELFGVVNRLQNRVVYFKGFDTNAIWTPLNNYQRALFPGHDVQFMNQDFFEYMEKTEDHVDILIFNYLLSDISRREDAAFGSDFIEKVVALCESGRISHIVINDIYLTYGTGTGYALMEEMARKLQANKNIKWNGWRGHFATPNEFQPTYGKKCNDSLTFPIVEPSVKPFNPFGTCGSLFMLIVIQ